MMDIATEMQAAVGLSEKDEERILASIRAPLLIQSPLQVLLETLFAKIKSQSSAMIKMSEQLDKLALGTGLEDRIRFLESRFDSVFGPPGSEPKLSPFKQQDIIDKLGHLEEVVANHTDDIASIQKTHEADTQPRLSSISTKLQGIENLAGRLVAQDVIAEELGITVPDLEDGLSLMRSTADIADHMRSARHAAREESSRSGKLAALARRVDATAEENDHLTTKLTELSEAMTRMTSSHAAEAQGAQKRLIALELENAELRSRLEDEMRAVRDVMHKQSTGADLGKLQSGLQTLSRHVDEQDVLVKHLQSSEIQRLNEEVFALHKGVEGALGMRDADVQFADSLKLLERDIEMLKKKLGGGLAAAMGADPSTLTGAARQSDLIELVAAMEQKADKAELQKMIRRAVALAVNAVQDMNDASEGKAGEAAANAGRALKFRCLSCDRDVEPTRPRPVGKLPSAQGLLPQVDRFPSARPTTPSLGPGGPGLNAAKLREQQADAHSPGGGNSEGPLDANSHALTRPTTPATEFHEAMERAASARSAKSALKASNIGPTPQRSPVFS